MHWAATGSSCFRGEALGKTASSLRALPRAAVDPCPNPCCFPVRPHSPGSLIKPTGTEENAKARPRKSSLHCLSDGFYHFIFSSRIPRQNELLTRGSRDFTLNSKGFIASRPSMARAGPSAPASRRRNCRFGSVTAALAFDRHQPAAKRPEYLKVVLALIWRRGPSDPAFARH